MPYKLYNRLGSGGFMVEASLTLANVDFELIEIDSKPSTPLPDWFKKINPWGQVPTLFTPDGTMMTESAAILIYIATLHHGENVGPELGTPEHAKLLRWLVFMSVNVYESILEGIYTDRYTTDPNGQAGVKAAAFKRQCHALDLLESQLKPGEFLLGPKMSVGDVFLALMYAWSNTKCYKPLLYTLTRRVASHPIIRPLWHKNFASRLDVQWDAPMDAAEGS